MMSQQGNFSRKRYLAVCLIICMILQLIGTSFVAPGYAQESASAIHKTIEVSEKEIRASLKRGTDSVVRHYVDEEKLPYDRVQNEEAARLIQSLLGDDSVIVRQDDLGDQCAAVIAVRVGQDAETREDVIENVFLIGLNGNKDRTCRFTLRIITDGGIVVERAYLTGYAAAWSGPGIATASDAEEVLASASDAAQAETEAVPEESMSNEGEAETDALVETTAAQEETDERAEGDGFGTSDEVTMDGAAEPTKASASDVSLSEEIKEVIIEETIEETANTEIGSVTAESNAQSDAFDADEAQDSSLAETDTAESNAAETAETAAETAAETLASGNDASASDVIAWTADPVPFEEQDAKTLEGDELSALVKNSGVFAAARRMFSLNADSEARATAEAYGLIVLQTTNNADNLAGQKIYFVNMYDQAIASELYTHEGAQLKTQAFDRVDAIFLTEADADPNQKDGTTGDDGAEAGKTSVMEVYDDGVFRVEIPQAARGTDSYTRVTFRVYPREEGADPNGQLIGRTYRFNGGSELEGGSFQYEPITNDCLFYSGRGDTSKIASCYWNAHPTANPDTLDGQILYLDLGKLKKVVVSGAKDAEAADTKADDKAEAETESVADSSALDSGSSTNETVNLWLWYMTDKEREDVENQLKADPNADIDYGKFAHRIAMKTLSDTVYRYWIPYESGLDENSELVLLGKNADDASETAAGANINLNDVYSFPFIYSMDSGKNMIHVDYLMSDEDQDKQDWAGIWGIYAPEHMAGNKRYVLFDNELTAFDTENVYAVIWKHTGEDCAFEQVTDDDSTMTEKPNGTDQKKLKAWNKGIDEKFLKLTAYDSMDAGGGEAANFEDGADIGQALVVKLQESEKENFPENWAQVKNALGAEVEIPKSWGTDLHVRYFAWDGTVAGTSTANAEDASEESFFSIASVDETERYADAGAFDAGMATLADLQEQLRRAGSEDKNDGINYDQETGYNDGIYNISQTLVVDNNEDYPCYYAAKGHNNLPLHGKWDSVFAVNTLGDESENNPTGTFVYDTTKYYGSANIIDFYSDYELTGHTRETFLYDEANKDNKDARERNPYPADVENGLEALKGKIAPENDRLWTASWDDPNNNGGGGRYPGNNNLYINNIIYGNQGYTLNYAISEYYKTLENNSDGKQNATINPLYFGNSELNAFKDYSEGKTNFYGMGNNENNTWRGGWSGVRSGLMAKRLSQNGNLQINSKKKGSDGSAYVYDTPYFSESFVRGDNALNTAIGKAYNNVLFPFRKDEKGYWMFDSANANDAVRMMKDETTGAYFLAQADKGEDSAYAVSIASSGNPKYQFLPFNDPIPINYTQTGKGKNDGIKTGRYNGYGLSGSKHAKGAASIHNLNNMFSMRLDIPFYLTSNGKVDMLSADGTYREEDIVFRFSGDDDVWIYVDGMLALDLGGIHDYGLCEINFGKKTITQRGGLSPASGSINDKDKIDWEDRNNKWKYEVTYDWTGQFMNGHDNGKPLGEAEKNEIASMVNPELMNLDYSKAHTITVFYMERGLHCSNLKMSFNFATENSFTVKNEIDTSKVDEARETRKGNQTLALKYNLGMAKLFEEAADHLGSFDFSIMNAATSGRPLPVEQSQGYLLPGGTKDFNALDTLGDASASELFSPYYQTGSDIWYVRASEKDYGKEETDKAEQAEAVSARTAKTGATLNFRSWGTADTDATQEAIERRLVNVYPSTKGADGATSRAESVRWPKENQAGAIEEKVPLQDDKGKFVYDKDGNIQYTDEIARKSAEYLRFELYSTADVPSLYGSALYVGLLDIEGNRVGGWANELNYNDYINDIQAKSWNVIRISKEKLKATVTKFQKHDPADSTKLLEDSDGTPVMQTEFLWDRIKAVQLCYYDQTEMAVRNIAFCAKPTQYDARSFQVENDEISDFKSLKEDAGNAGVYDSKLSPAYGAWYNTRGIMGENGVVTNNPVMVDKRGHFSLGNNGAARFTDKFRTGSYLSVRMNDLNERIFTTNWTLQEGEENIPASALLSKTSTEVNLSAKLINPTNHAGRKPYDGREENLKSEQQEAVATEALETKQAKAASADSAQSEQTNAETGQAVQEEVMPFGERLIKKIQSLAASFMPDKAEVRAGDDASSPGKIKGSLDLHHPEDADGAGNANTLVFRSFLDPDNSISGFHIGVKFLTTVDTAGIVLKKEVENSESDVDEKEYHFIIVYDDIADMGLELNFKNTFAYEGVDLKADEAKKVDVIAGTRYRIYELEKSVSEIEKELNPASAEEGSGEAGEERAIKSIADLTPYLSDTLVKVQAGAGVEQEDGTYRVDTNDTNTAHDEVGTYDGTDFARSHSHASGRAYTKMRDGSEGKGLQGFVFTNRLKPEEAYGSVTLQKVGVDAEGKVVAEKLAGAVFELYDADTGTLHGSKTYRTDKNGTFTIENLPVGTYYLVEIEAPTGYVLDPTHHAFDIEADQTEAVTIQANNLKRTDKYGQLTIQKYDESNQNKLLDGAEFELYRVIETAATGEEASETADKGAGTETTVTINGESLQVKLFMGNIVTGADDMPDGKYIITGLPYGRYYLKETKAPTGYKLPEGDAVWKKFTIGGTTEAGKEDDPEKANVFIEVPNTPLKAKFRVTKAVQALAQATSGDLAYKKDNFIIRIRQVTDESGTEEVADGLKTDLVLKDGETSEWIGVNAYDGALYFRIEELVPMEYDLNGMAVSDNTETGVVSGLDTGRLTSSGGFAILTVRAGAEATVTVNNQEKHTHYFHDTTNVTNTAKAKSEGGVSSWKFAQKQKDGEASKKTALHWALPTQDESQERKKEKKGRRAEE